MSRNALFFNSENNDRVYDSDDFSDWLRKFFTTGVFYGDLQVTANNDMTVNVNPGYTNVEGKVMIFDTISSLIIETANPTYDRIDTVVIERNDTNREITLKVIKGGYSTEPTPIAPVRANGIYQLVIAEVFIAHGATAITQSVITDKRANADVCGYVITPIDTFDFSQFATQFEAYLREFKESSAVDFNQWMINEQLEFNTWKNAEKSDFDTWFANIRYILDGDVAGHLQNEIDELSEKIDNIKLVHIKVSYDAQSLAGGTITVSNGSESYSKPVNASGETIFDGMSLGIWTISENVQGTSAEIETNFYGNYSAAVGGDIFINVSFDDEFRGKTITCTDGSKTYTRVATGSRVQFCLNDEGTWTIKATVDDKEYSTTVTVRHNNTYDVTLRYARGLDYTEWLTQAGITKSFASLEDVLADQPTVRTLMTKHASVDYLADYCDEENAEIIFNAYNVMKWVNLRDYALDTLMANNSLKAVMDSVGMYGYGEVTLKGNVPIMTANNAPYGEASASSVYGSGYEAYKAFDGDSNTRWHNSGTATSHTLGYKFTNPICVGKFGVASSSTSGRYPQTIELQYSDDGSTYTTIGEPINPDYSSASEYKIFKVDNNEYHLYYRVKFNMNGSSAYDTDTLQFYGRELKVSVPKMDSNTSPWGTAMGSTPFDSGYSWTCGFNNSLNNGQLFATKFGEHPWIGYDFGSDVSVRQFFVKAYNAQCIAKFYIEYSDNGINWTRGSNEENLTSTVNGAVCDCSNYGGHRYWRAYCDQTFNDTGRNSLFQFYALDYSEHDERYYIYDHGVEVEEIVIENDGGAKLEKRDSELYLFLQGGTSGTDQYYINKKIDYTPYRLARYTYGKELALGWTNYLSFNYFESGLYHNASGSTTKVQRDLLPEIIYTDISALNEICGQSIGTNYTGSKITIAEWWLE